MGGLLGGSFAPGGAAAWLGGMPGPLGLGGPLHLGLAGGAMRRGSGGARGGQLAQLSLMDRDFGEADYEMLLKLDEVDDREKKAALRANAKRLDALPARRLSKAELRENGEDAVCAICLESVREKQLVITLQCKHDYHKSCILKWLKSCETPSCPQCKAPALVDGGGDLSPHRTPSPEEQWWPHT